MRQVIVWHSGKWYELKSIPIHQVCEGCVALYDSKLCEELNGGGYPWRCESSDDPKSSEVFKEIAP